MCMDKRQYGLVRQHEFQIELSLLPCEQVQEGEFILGFVNPLYTMVITFSIVDIKIKWGNKYVPSVKQGHKLLNKC